MRIALVCLLTTVVLLGGARLHAQPVRFETACTLYDVGGVAQAGPPIAIPDRSARRGGAATNVTRTVGRAATFIVSYTGFTPEAEAAFQAAVDIWADHVSSSVPVRIDADFEALGDGVLGAAGPNIFPAPPGAPFPNTYYASALADAIAGADLGTGSSDIVATFNSDFDRFYFGTDGNPPPNQFDFTTIVLHEIGHGLGFIGSGSVDDGATAEGNVEECEGVEGQGCWGYFQTATGTVSTGLPLIFDRFVEDRAGRDFLDQRAYPNPSRTLGNLLQSQDLFVAAPTVVQVNRGERAPVWAPATFESGSSFSHWDEILFTSGTSAALMTPRVAPGEAYRDPGSITCAFFQDMGWPLGAGCTLLVGGGGGETAPDISVSPTALSFGDVAVGSTGQRVVTVQNEGDADLTVSSVSIDGGDAFTVGGGADGFTLAPGGERRLTVSFSPTATGEQGATLTVQSDDADEGSVTVQLTGIGTAPPAPQAAVSPSSVAFGEVTVGASETATVTVTNDGDAALDISGVTVQGSGTFSVSDGGGAATLSPGASRAITVAFAPTETGDQAATLTIRNDNDADREVSLSGTGRAGTAGGADPDALGFDGSAAIAVAPNPYRGRAGVELRVRDAQRVTVAVFDVLGRRVLHLHDGPVRAGETLALALEAGRLAPGTYVVRAAGERFVASAPVVVVR